MNLFEETFIKHRNLAISNQLNEIFVIQQKEKLKQELIVFLQKQFESGNIKPIHAGLSATDYKPIDWIEPMADVMIQHMVKYFEMIRAQTERNIYSSVPIASN
jgi:hypothetical protein